MIDQKFVFHMDMFNHGTEKKQNYLDKHKKVLKQECWEILRHPVMMFFTALKWYPHKKQYYFNVFLFVLFLISLSLHGIRCIDFLQCNKIEQQNKASLENQKIFDRNFDVCIGTLQFNKTETFNKTTFKNKTVFKEEIKSCMNFLQSHLVDREDMEKDQVKCERDLKPRYVFTRYSTLFLLGKVVTVVEFLKVCIRWNSTEFHILIGMYYVYLKDFIL